MKLGRLKEIIKDIDNDELEIFIRNSNSIGNIGELEQIEISTFGCFGTNVHCLILNTPYSKIIEVDEIDHYIDFIK